MRVIGWICVGFFAYYLYDAGGIQEGVNQIAGEIYWATMPEPVGTDIIEDVQDNVDRIYEKINKSVDTIIK
jgi:hypothetical protein